jgi:eukaryotic-like serine/threonine-protein kinase
MPGGVCVGEHDLCKLLLGDLPEPLALEISRHLEVCPRCEQAARRLDANSDSFLSTLREAAKLPEAAKLYPQGPTAHGSGGGPAKSSGGTGACVRLPHVTGYETLEELGRGGMSVVYKARQQSPRRLVALKMITERAHASRERRARLLAEADAIARLQHPHIVQIYEAGEHEGVPFLALEFMSGGSLAEQVKGPPCPPRQAAALVEQLAGAVHHAHECGIIHRDLKPANVLLAGDGTPKLADFGLAKYERPELTATGAILGTPSYMAPEQTWQDNRTPGRAVDIYSLGAILYELLTGRPPFGGATVLETLEWVRSHEPVPPAQLRADFPRDLSTICLKCLEKEPARRYATAQTLAEDLRRYLNGEPILAREVGLLERTWRWCRREPRVASLVAAVFGVLLAGALLSGYFAVTASREARAARKAEQEAEEKAEQARREAKRADDEAAVARAVREFLQIDLFRQSDTRHQAVDRDRPNRNPNITVRELLDRAARKSTGGSRTGR